MLTKAEYWVWLQTALGPGQRTAPLLEYFGSPQALYHATQHQRRLSGLLNSWQLRRLEETGLEEARQILETCHKHAWAVTTPDNGGYPHRLRTLEDFPLALYSSGTLPAFDEEVCISMVGTRKASLHGIEAATRLSAGLARAGAIIISGGALGIDSAAHQGALAVRGRTIAVLGCGFGTDYLRKNEGLRRAIAASCCVLTEFPPFTQAAKYTFPIRNRLIAGLSLGTVVVEAAVKSGALITARFAQAQGRDVFAVAGSVIDPANNGTNHLIHDGAKPVFCPLDVLEEYPQFYGKLDMTEAGKPLSESAPPQAQLWKETETAVNNPLPPQNIIKKGLDARKAEESGPVLPQGLSALAKQIWGLLEGGERHVDFLSTETGMTVREVLPAVTELELYGLVRVSPGRRLQRCQNKQ